MTGQAQPIFVGIEYALLSIPNGSNPLNYRSKITWDRFSATAVIVADFNIFRLKTLLLKSDCHRPTRASTAVPSPATEQQKSALSACDYIERS